VKIVSDVLERTLGGPETPATPISNGYSFG